jgi:hypothetical protein
MIFPLPLFFVLAAGPVGEVREVVREKLEIRDQAAAVADRFARMGLMEARLWRETWVIVRGVLTEEGARALGVEGSVGKVAVLATQSVPGGWTLGMLSVQGRNLRVYVQGPGRVKAEQVIPYAFSFDGGLVYSGQGFGLADGTIAIDLPQMAGRKGKFRFGPREVVFDTSDLHPLARCLNRLEFPVEPEPEAAAAVQTKTAVPVQEPPPAFRIK